MGWSTSPAVRNVGNQANIFATLLLDGTDEMNYIRVCIPEGFVEGRLYRSSGLFVRLTMSSSRPLTFHRAVLNFLIHVFLKYFQDAFHLSLEYWIPRSPQLCLIIRRTLGIPSKTILHLRITVSRSMHPSRIAKFTSSSVISASASSVAAIA